MDDAAIVAPDTWSGKNEYIAKRWGHDNSIITFPPRKQFYCTERRVEVALLSSDMYFTTGVRYLLEGMRDMILHVYKSQSELYTASAKSFDVAILSASDTKDISAIYHMILKLRLTGQNTFIFVVADNDIRHVLASIARRHSGVKILGSHEKMTVLKQELMKLLTERENKKQNQYFPATLTPRQADILLMAADGLSAEDMALRAGVSTSTIYTTKARALDKAGATNKALEAILYAQVRDGKLHPDLQHHSSATYSTSCYSHAR
ncbi:helix-turn-helix domain-containing protein [Pseudescherichia vulneris]